MARTPDPREPHAPSHSAQRRGAGFTLLELVMVLGVVGALAGVILPNIGVTYTSQMREALSTFASTVRTTFDSAILESRIHRLVLRPHTGEYFTEIAPIGFEGRPTSPWSVDPKERENRAEIRAKLLEELDRVAAEPRKSSEDEKRSYSFRSLLVANRAMLRPVEWREVSDALLTHRALPGRVVFASAVTEEMRDALPYSEAGEKDAVYIYFFPNAQTQMASVQMAMGKDKQIDEQGPKYTLNLDPLSGQVEILDGLVDAEFIKQRK